MHLRRAPSAMRKGCSPMGLFLSVTLVSLLLALAAIAAASNDDEV